MLEKLVRQLEAGIDIPDVKERQWFYWSQMSLDEFAVDTAKYNVEFWSERSKRTTLVDEKINCSGCDDVIMGPHDMIVCLSSIYHLACNAVLNPPEDEKDYETRAMKSLAIELFFQREPTIENR